MRHGYVSSAAFIKRTPRLCDLMCALLNRLIAAACPVGRFLERFFDIIFRLASDCAYSLSEHYHIWWLAQSSDAALRVNCQACFT